MRKTKEVLRLRFELGLGQRQIARSCGMGLGTVHQYLERAVAAGIGWPLPGGWSEEDLEAKLFGNQPVQSRAVRQRPQPDWKAIHEQLQQHRHLTLQLVWEEYRQANPEGYRYSWFCERYQHWRRHLDVVLRQEHKAGEKMFVDWAGATIPVYDARSGQAWPASLFVSVLGASSYTYAEATRDQQLEAWIQAHIHALEFFGGVPRLTVPDNTKTAVTRACRYDPDLNPTYQEFAVHYGMGVVPARPYRPRDAGHSKQEVIAAIKATIDKKELPPLEQGTVSYMMSKSSYLSDYGGHNAPHLMFFQTDKPDAAWGANLTNSPVLSVNYWYISAEAYPQLKTFPPLSVFLVVVDKWSDGTPAPPM